MNFLVKFVFFYIREGPALRREISPKRARNFPNKLTQKGWPSYYARVLDPACWKDQKIPMEKRGEIQRSYFYSALPRGLASLHMKNPLNATTSDRKVDLIPRMTTIDLHQPSLLNMKLDCEKFRRRFSLTNKDSVLVWLPMQPVLSWKSRVKTYAILTSVCHSDHAVPRETCVHSHTCLGNLNLCAGVSFLRVPCTLNCPL